MSEGTVLLRRSSLGDVVLLGSVTSTVEPPVTVVTAPEWVPVAERLRGVSRVIAWPKDLRRSDVLREVGRAAHWVDLHSSLRSFWLSPFSPRIDKRSVRRRLGLWFHHVGPKRPSVPALYAEACGTSPVEPPWMDGSDRPRNLLAVVPGASFATKRWAVVRFRELVSAWDGPVVILGGPSEEELCSHVAAGNPRANVIVETGFTTTIDVLLSTRVAVVGDTGLMHLAGACGARVVALFGPTHPNDGFFVYSGEVVERVVPCRPCTLHGRDVCPKGHLGCMDIDVATVLSAIRRAWGESCAGSF